MIRRLLVGVALTSLVASASPALTSLGTDFFTGVIEIAYNDSRAVCAASNVSPGNVMVSIEMVDDADAVLVSTGPVSVMAGKTIRIDRYGPGARRCIVTTDGNKDDIRARIYRRTNNGGSAGGAEGT